MAGIYRVQHLKKQGLEEERFAVHVDPRESNLDAADRGVIETLLESKPGDGAAALVADVALGHCGQRGRPMRPGCRGATRTDTIGPGASRGTFQH